MTLIRYYYYDFKELNRIALLNTPNEKPYVKSKGSLESVVRLLYQTIFGVEVHPTDFDKMSYIYFLLVKKHCFGNGNKRTALLYLVSVLPEAGYLVRPNVNLLQLSVWVATLPYTDESLNLVRSELQKVIVQIR